MRYIFFLLALLLQYSSHSQEAFPMTAMNGATHKRIDTYANNREGEKVLLRDYMEKGNIYLVSVWATWCGPCRRELSAINEIHQEWSDKYGVECIALSTDRPNSVSKVWRMVDQNKWDFTIFHDLMGYVQRELEVFNLPQTFLVDQDLNIVYQTQGFTSQTIPLYQKKIAALYSKKK